VGHATRKLGITDIEPTAALLARAFADNPAYCFMHPRESTRRSDMIAFFRRNLLWHLPLDLTWVTTDDSDRPIGTATLEPPGGIPARRLCLVWHWVLPTLLFQGRAVLQRTLAADAAFSALNRQTAESDAYWHVHAVAVDPLEQRGGVGTQLLGHVFAELDRLIVARPAPVILSTQRESNVRLYARFGFEECGKVTIGEGEPDAFVSWCMRRGEARS
jgi:GNAT superfamily N-acetyltransferase